MNRPEPRVLLIDENKDFGGAENHVITLATELRELGVLEAVVARKDSWLHQASLGEIPFHETSFRNEIDMFSVFNLYRKIKASGANILHCIAHRDLVAAALARQLPGSPPSVLVKAEHSFPDPKLTPLFRWSYRECHCVVAVSEALKNQFQEQVELAKRIPVEVIPNGIEVHQNRPVQSQASRPLRIGVLSALREGKGHADVLRAIARLSGEFERPIEWLFAGAGPLESELKDLARDLNVEVEFLGHCENSHHFLSSLDISVLPSHRETFSLVALETLLSGRPLLAADSEGVQELCGEHVHIYPKGDIKALARELKTILGNLEVEQKIALAEAAGYQQRYSKQTMGKSYLELYHALIEQHLGPPHL